ncbi:MAG: exopolysaccharide biosynthesis polyprenyl glycosylphosphotransferase [Streptosporangiaceae bacterium]|jgi:exopolysaccharide biosynthesis polyprenyl glycosylphosphotransferase|nr:exopolysaccharide biosynthesis polyprenyl glycosylphosphotransferase [Streptosporangiaceae bacterium]
MAVIDRVRADTHFEPDQRRHQPTPWTAWYVRCAICVDFLSVLAAGLIAFGIRFPGAPSSYSAPYIPLTVSLPFLWLMMLGMCRAYEPRLIGVGSEEFRRVLQAGFTLTASVAILAYATKTEVARGYVVMALPLATLLNLFWRYLLRKRLHRLRMAGTCMRNVVAVGHRGAMSDLIRQLRREPYHGMDVVGVCLPSAFCTGDDAIRHVEGIPVLGDFTEAALVVDSTGADTVAVLACPEMDGVALRRLAWQLEKNDIDLVVAPALMDVAGPRTSIRPVAGLPLLHVEHPELTGGRQVVKSLFDRTGALFALLLLAPLFGAVAVAIRATSGGPVLFRQIRVGRDGRDFTVLKFRTMVSDAEARKVELAEHNEHLGDGVLFKVKSDPRITAVGGWLRRYSIDELPQLINVLRGDMSLVGPRPPLPEEVAKYGDDVRRRLVVKPGMTGLWQVSGRSDLSWEESVRLDLRYVENWSLMLDLQILWRTWSAVAHGAGAY